MPDQLSRRDFWKLSGLGLAGLMAPPLDLGQDLKDPENQKWKDNRFFEKIDDFDSKMFLEIRGQLLEFGERYVDVFQNHQLTHEFSLDVWAEGVKDTMQQLNRISKVYNTLKKDNLLDSVSRELLEKDFYETGSYVWIILRAGELNNPQKMLEALDEISNFDTKQYFDDPIVGDEFATIKTLWADRLASHDSPIIKMINHGMYSYSNHKWWQINKGPQALSVYKKDELNNKRPAEITVHNDSEQFVKLVEKALSESRLNRIGINFNTLGSEVNDYSPNNSAETPRQINMVTLSQASDLEVTKKAVLVQAVAVHEAGHALYDLIPFLGDDIKVFGHRVKLEKLLRKFDSCNNLELLFGPEGNFLDGGSLSQMREDPLEFRHESYLTLNISTLTLYLARQYIGELSAIEQLGYDIARYNNNKQDNIFHNLTATTFYNGDDTFSAYWSRLKNDIKKDKLELNEIEVEMMRRIDNDAGKFDAYKRMFYLEHEESSDWQSYLDQIVLPSVLVDAYSKDPKMVISKMLNSVNVEPEKLVALESHIDVVLGLLANKKNNSFTSSWIDGGTRRSLTEMFAELVAGNYLRTLPGVKDEISPELWMEINNVINSMIDDLVIEGLAVQSNRNVV